MHILLLNPPGHQAYIRDYYCSKVSKTNYLFPPVDLLILSGILAQDHYVSVVDAIADHQSADDVIRTFDSLKPDVVISLVGAVALADDLRFLNQF